jgi:hypothetical protein
MTASGRLNEMTAPSVFSSAIKGCCFYDREDSQDQNPAFHRNRLHIYTKDETESNKKDYTAADDHAVSIVLFHTTY